MTNAKYPDDGGLKDQVRDMDECKKVADVIKEHYGAAPVKDLKYLIKGSCTFQFYRDSQLWYKTEFGSFVFPVPVEDITNGATFNNTEKGLMMMRYIRKHLKTLEEANV